MLKLMRAKNRENYKSNTRALFLRKKKKFICLYVSHFEYKNLVRLCITRIPKCAPFCEQLKHKFVHFLYIDVFLACRENTIYIYSPYVFILALFYLKI